MIQADFTDHSKQTESFLQSALDALSAHIAILDHDGNIIGVNNAWCDFAEQNAYGGDTYGVGTNYLGVCDDSSGRFSREAPSAANGIRDVLEGEVEEFRLEYPCHSPTEKRWFVMHVTRFGWNSEPRVIVAHQNVTELKSVQVELADSQRRIQTILDNVINGIITLDTNGEIESINPAGASIFGYDIQEMFSMSITDLIARRQNEVTATTLLRRLQGGGDHEMVGRRKDGSEFRMYFALSRVVIGNRRIYTGIVQDITDRKQMEAERLERERLAMELEQERDMRELKNRFISMMSHELRTPLASIMLSSDLLKRYGDQAPPEEKDLYIDNITTQVALLTDLIRDVSTISRSEAHKTTIMPELTNVVEYCRSLVDEFRLTNQQNHTLIFSGSREEIKAMVDRKLMRQVFSNLITNALKYTPPGGEVIVYVSNGGRFVTVRVTDNGIGIPKDDMKKLFDPFHRASNVDTLPGTGLGLTIAQQAVELHGGSITVESEVNMGTSVTVSLPIHLHD